MSSSELSLLLSGLGIGGLFGAFLKSILDKRHLKFSKVFDFKEGRYKAIMIEMWTAMKPTPANLRKMQYHRPELQSLKDVEDELELEYYNAMLFASDEVLETLKAFNKKRNEQNWRQAARAMKKDLYL